MKYLLPILMTVILAWVSLSCDCIMTPIETHIKETDFIVTGQVCQLLDNINDENYYFKKFDSTRSYMVKIRVLNSYKGRLKEGQIIELGSKSPGCSLYFFAGGKYLLFLTKDKNSDKYFQRICSYSQIIEKASNDINTIERQIKYKHKK